MRGLLWLASGAVMATLLIAAGGFVYATLFAHGFSASVPPSAIERSVAAVARSWALPRSARDRQNPVPASDEVLAEGKAHWADHCASCHANDGSGQVPLGRQMYPPAPDMRGEETQKKTDGELFYVIENGVRLTGMPAWGGNPRHEVDSWKLVRFIRHLPALTPAEIRQMESLNPKTPDDIEEEKQEEEFLKGGDPTGRCPKTITTTERGKTMKSIAITTALILGAALAPAHNGVEHIMGTVSAKSETAVTVETPRHAKVTVLLDRSTTYNWNDKSASLNDLKVGERVVVNAKDGPDEKLHCVSIRWGANSTAASDHGESAKK